MQVVYNANKLSSLVGEKKKKQNWLDFYQLRYSRNQSRRPIVKVFFIPNLLVPFRRIFLLYGSDIFLEGFGLK